MNEWTTIGVSTTLFLTLLGAFALVLNRVKRKKLPECEEKFSNIEGSLTRGNEKFADLRNRSEENGKNIVAVKTELKGLREDIKEFKGPLMKYLKKNGNTR